jgi:excinuclease UvrABC nuclease subunit
MTNNETVHWPGASGRTYEYWFLDLHGSIKSEPGNYMFVRRLPNGNFSPLYIGQADNLASRIPNHERLADARRAGATHVMAHTTQGGEAARLAEERDLIQRWQPQLNVQHRRVN